MEVWKDKDRQTDTLFYRTLPATAGGPKTSLKFYQMSTIKTAKLHKNW